MLLSAVKSQGKERRYVSLLRQRGITMIELVLAIIVTSIIAVPIAIYASGSVKAFMQTKDNINALTKIRNTGVRITKEIRKLNYNGAQFDVSSMTASQFQFVNTDGITVRFDYNAVTQLLSLYYSTPALTATLADQVVAGAFVYYRSDGITAAGSGADIAFVEYSFTLQEGGVSYSTRNRIMLRDRQ